MGKFIRVGVIAALTAGGSVAALMACGGDDDAGSSTSSSGGSSGGSSGASSSGGSSGASSGTTSSGGSSGSSGDSGVDSGAKVLTGKLDATYKNGTATGVTLTFADGIAVDAKSRVYVFGSGTGCADGSSNGDFTVVRFTATGDLDTAFGSGGRACVDVGATNATDGAYAAGFDGQNRVVLAGTAGTLGNARATLVRFNENGSLDTTFNSPNGALSLQTMGASNAFAVDVDSAGSIIVAGGDSVLATSAVNAFIAKVTPQGALDNTFGGGIQGLDARWIRAVARSGTKVYAAGMSKDTPGRATVFEYDATGDASAAWGVAAPSSGAGYESAMSLDLRTNGSAVITGVADGNLALAIGGSAGPGLVAQYTSTGALDGTFNAGGARPGTTTTSAVAVRTIQNKTGVIDGDGRPILAGIFEPDGGAQDPALQRFTLGGAPDNNFGSSSVVHVDAGVKQARVIGVARDAATGKVVVLTTTGAANTWSVFRFE